ncbi:CMRF35-like molecule 2 isoform X2 [Moschus berezovskii]|uniref:CMRF35-like molecule 2 isoform X2 n=1 Tax=Moschus berezovskii TaxID=68408 RepID=UPI0024449D51|nr:CMRF35-like molecule 2 isoform X2 [Moschus berezovskii]
MAHASPVMFPSDFKQTAADGASWDGALGSDLCFPGCFSLMGPGSVVGTTGSSLRVRCQYEKAYKGHNKYWCRGKYGTVCRKIVETKGEEKEERNGRVSIRDHADNLTFTVTMENLSMNDAGSYWCRIQTVWILDALSWDPSVQVEVSVSPGSTACPAVPGSLPTVNDGQNLSTKETSTHCPGSWLSNIHLLLLVFLKLPLFLSMVGAVLWVNRPQRRPGGRERQLDQGGPPYSMPSPGTPCPGIQLFRLDKRDLQILGSRAGGKQLLDFGRTQVFWGHWSREGPGS